jgi:hypothetical protein
MVGTDAPCSRLRKHHAMIPNEVGQEDWPRRLAKMAGKTSTQKKQPEIL